MQEKNKCPNCGQHRMHARRTSVIMIGVFLLLVAMILVPWGPFFGGLEAMFFWAGIGFIVLSVFVKGQVCANCRYSSLHAHA